MLDAEAFSSIAGYPFVVTFGFQGDLAVRARNGAERSSQVLLCSVTDTKESSTCQKTGQKPSRPDLNSSSSC